MNILFTGGGTAGHVNPAVAIAEYVRGKDAVAGILFVGREGGDENRAIKNAGFELEEIKIQGLARGFIAENLKRLSLALGATKRAKEIIRVFKPDVIVGTGGYVSWPSLSAGISMHIPCVIHESNAYPGLVTRLLSSRCERILINLDGARDHLKNNDRIVTVGNPIRKGFFDIERGAARRMLGLKAGDTLIISFGGSGGSDRMNEACIGLMKSYSLRNPRVRHVHATGKRYYNRYKINEADLCYGKSGCRIVSYIEEMPLMLRACDIAITRCGAVTLTELCCVGAAAILVPSPNVTNDHQLKNALYLKEKNAAIVIEEADLDERSLVDAVRRIEGDASFRKTLCEGSRGLYVEGSAEKIYKELLSIVGRT